MSGANPRPDARATALVEAARWARLAAALGLAALSLYFLVEIGFDTASTDASMASAPSRRSSVLPRPDGAPAPDDQHAPPLSPSARAEAPPPSPRQILVDLGPPRSEVFVDGRRVGQSPFLGQVRCRPGQPISIQVIPERGLPLEEKRVCPP